MLSILLAAAVSALVWRLIDRYAAKVAARNEAELIHFHNTNAEFRRAVRADRIARLAAIGRNPDGSLVRK